ncbi:MAG TPA: universal stress protein [Bacillota bacterium]|nr:universal stress protein [Bacillota bacterium]
MKKILLPTDGSAHSLKAAEYARELMERFPESFLTIIHVTDLPRDFLAHGYMPEAVIDPQIVQALADERDERIMDATFAKFEGLEERVNMITRTGIPVEIICHYAETQGCDLIVVGSRGLSEIKGLFLGSVSDRISHLAVCPVLIVK